ncbi:MAG: hypothetical protein EZS28_004950 [Streblomastix strix]|uniref:Signal recognition particle 19 kDa protein n=1 Tax=Streblomastix strix TaxID=222440 RepID=A0A5J4WYH2_9EUKA|nr:MAG: hypothetical protein EZS28_004950 [Streblomastix strix]
MPSSSSSPIFNESITKIVAHPQHPILVTAGADGDIKLYNHMEFITTEESGLLKTAPEIYHWHVIYPAYLDSTKKKHEGRLVNKEIAVENPTINEIVAACKEVGLETRVEEKKKYSRDFFSEGRVRVQIYARLEGDKQVKAFVKENIRNKNQLLNAIAPIMHERRVAINSKKDATGKKKKK